MSKKYVSEEAVKKALAINSFREVSKEKIVDFISMIPNMDKDVAISIINQFPVYTDFANNVIATLKEMCDNIITSGDISQREIMAMYRQALDAFEKNLNNDDCTPEERQEIRQVMLLIVEQASKKDSEHKQWLIDLAKGIAPAIGIFVVGGLAILGVNIKGKDIPILKK